MAITLSKPLFMRKILLHNLLVLVGLLYSANANAYDFEKDGILYNILSVENQTAEVTYYAKKWGYWNWYSGDIVVPASVEYNNQTYSIIKIGESAFINCPDITSITLPATIDSICENSFAGCTGISSINIPKNVKSIKSYAFSNCSSLSNITFSEGKAITCGEEVMYGTKWLSDQPNGVVYLGNSVYQYKGTMPENCTINIKEGTYSICNSAFINQVNLSSIKLPNSLKYIGDGAFYGCSGLTSINIPNSTIEIGYNCFAICENLEEITLPNSLEKIGSECFISCKKLKAIEIPNKVTTLFEKTFYNCPQLKAIKLSSSLKSIGNECFNYCTSLTSISIPGSVENIGNCVFQNCNSLTKVRFENSDKTLISGYGYCYKDNYYPGSSYYHSTYYGVFYDCPINYVYFGRNLDCRNEGKELGTGLEYVKNIEVGGNVTQLNDINLNLKYGMEKLIIHDSSTELEISGTIHTIDTLYIGRDTNLKFSDSNIKCARISGSTKHIIDKMFSNCSALDSVAIESNIQSIGDEAFNKCSNLTKIKFPESLESIDNTAFAGTGLIDVVIPNKVKSIGHSAFAGDKNLIHISLGEKLSSIGYWAFHQTSITSVIIPKTVTYIGEGAFAECKKLDKVFMKTSTAEVASNAFEYGGVNYRITYAPNTNYSSLGGIGKTIVSNLAVNIFEDGDCIYLPLSGTKKTCAIVDWKNHAKEKNIVIPSSVKYGKQTLKPVEIGINTFYGCDITSLKLPENITVIDDNACNSCESLKSVILDEALTSIEEQAFYNCTSLDTVYFGKELKTIGASAFYGANRIKHINLQDAVTSIGANAFDGCSDLTTITLGCNVANIKDAAFANCANVTDIISYNPKAPVCVKGVFDSVDKFSCNVYVPKNSVDIYASATEWEDFFNLIEMPYEGGIQTITLNVSKYLWSTLILPFDAEIPAGLKVYDVYDTDETGCVPTEVDKIKANVPYLVKGIMGKYKFSGISKAIEETYSNGLLTGTHVSNYEAPIGSYVLQYHIGSGFAFYKVNRDGIMLPANRCYLTKDASAAKFLVPFVTEETTGINDITNDVANTASTIYTLDGKVVNASKQNQNGIFVVDGKKVIIK